MKALMLIGILLIVFGIGSLAYEGITYTSREKIIDFGSIKVTANTKKTLPISPLVGGISIIGGIVLVVVGRKK
ncbi:MAG: DUF3185 domain-containing protein [Calditrichota bacterium]